jgi:hypothetical protein
MLMGAAMPLASVLGLVAMSYLLGFNSPTPLPSTTLAWGSRGVYVVVVTLFAAPLLYLVAAGIAIKTYPRGARKRRRAILRAIRQAEDASGPQD